VYGGDVLHADPRSASAPEVGSALGALVLGLAELALVLRRRS
jgi:hypothetical protein